MTDPIAQNLLHSLILRSPALTFSTVVGIAAVIFNDTGFDPGGGR